MPGPKIDAGVPRLLFARNAPRRRGSDPPPVGRHPDGQRFLITNRREHRGRNTAAGGIPTFPPNLVADRASRLPRRRDPSPTSHAPPSNGLTVIRHWTAAFRKAGK